MGLCEFIYISLICMSLGIHLVKHGEYRNDKYNFWTGLITATIEFVLLYFGGFFK